MIVRSTGSSKLLITQPDHAALAARIMQQWSADGFPDSPRRSAILWAIEEHDNGWREVDAAPLVDDSGQILDFVNAPDAVRRDVWPRGIERLSATPYAAALVAEHAMHIYRRYRENQEWTRFFIETEAARDRHLRATPSATLDELLHDYTFLRLGDLLSLTFCNAWTDVQTDEYGYGVRVDGAHLIVTPDPFDGRSVPLDITARELPDRAFQSPEEAERVLAAAKTVTLTGLASG